MAIAISCLLNLANVIYPRLGYPALLPSIFDHKNASENVPNATALIAMGQGGDMSPNIWTRGEAITSVHPLFEESSQVASFHS